ncbi:MAG TPA: hypothetical protein VEZ90_05005 [Blastocatellia bacterium]|nr:hypothetical protein [Blastocatellia bacterium]
MTQEILALVSGGGGAVLLKAIELTAKQIRSLRKDAGERSAAALAARANVDIALIQDGAAFRQHLLDLVRNNEERVEALQADLQQCNQRHAETQELMIQREREHEALKREHEALKGEHEILSQQHGELSLKCRTLESEVEQLRVFSVGLRIKDSLLNP